MPTDQDYLAQLQDYHARHGVLPRQIDPSAAMIKFAEGRGWVYSVKWPKPERVEAKLARPATMGS